MSCLKSIKSHDSLQKHLSQIFGSVQGICQILFCKSSCITFMFEGLNICQNYVSFFSLSPFFRQESVLIYFMPTVALKCNSVCLIGSHMKNYQKKKKKKVNIYR